MMFSVEAAAGPLPVSIAAWPYCGKLGVWAGSAPPLLALQHVAQQSHC